MRSLAVLAILALIFIASVSAESWFGSCDKELGKEYPPANEPSAIQTVVEMSSITLEQLYSGKPKYLRDAHPKTHGCVKAIFEVDANIAPQYQVGVFKPSAKYPAWIRFSNGNRNIQSDQEADSRGFAIKLMNVPGAKILSNTDQTQDFVGANFPIFFLETANDYIGFMKAAAAGASSLIQYFVTHLMFKELMIVKKFTGNPLGNPLTGQYWSATPYLFGNKAIKFTFKPVDCKTGARATDVEPGTSANYLGERVVESLKRSDFCYDFMIQEQQDACKQPVEDPREEWTTDFVKLARVRVFKQDATMTPALTDYCENLSFTPWHSLPVHRPLGGTNRCRRVVYSTIQRLRHQKNNATLFEPNMSFNQFFSFRP